MGRLIDADALNDMINRSYPMTDRIDVHNGYAICQEMIKQLPTIEERKRGEWIEENRRPRSMMFYCSECHRTAYDPQNHHGGQKRCRYAFCPNCGADMRGENNGQLAEG